MTKNTRIAFFVILDVVCFNASYLLAYLIVHLGEEATTAELTADYFSNYPTGFLILIGVKLLAMYVFSVYRILFEYAGAGDFRRVALSLFASTLASVTAAAVFGIEPALLPLIIFYSFIFDMGLGLATRLVYVKLTEVRKEDGEDDEQSLRRRYTPQRKNTGRVMIIGRGQAAAELIAEMQDNESLGRIPEVIVDDDKSHEGDTLLGVEIAAGRGEIRLRARRQAIDEIIIAKPGASKRYLASLLRECVKTTCRLSMLPLARSASSDAAMSQASFADLRKPTIADLLARERPRVDHREIGDQFKGRVVLVTGGAGVFGSELCRRIIRYKPRRLIALDMNEDGLAMLNAELEGYRTAETEFRTIVASVRDQVIMRRVFSAFRPHFVFHAAELKQIPLAQVNPRETYLTNVLGLKTTCDLADEFAAEKFILCSTVRAAAPTNVAGECKRMAELYITEKNEKSQTAYATARFSNLIEGRGNVIAVFEKQLLHGGPLTVTDKDIIRRFISAEEAALLTVLTAAIAEGGEVFELGPGEPMGIRELAEAMIRLSGKIPYEDIQIAVTQLRPGEMLFERERDSRTNVQAAERVWLADDDTGIKLPHWSQLWVQNPDHMDDVAVKDLLRLIFPTHRAKTNTIGNTKRGERIENE
ncbi:MAG: polysaccharide biosynthesis protein [Clostridiales bacterium]|nr:polysaccharide biosynthesis protein [Clostridiales bacterium]